MNESQVFRGDEVKTVVIKWPPKDIFLDAIVLLISSSVKIGRCRVRSAHDAELMKKIQPIQMSTAPHLGKETPEVANVIVSNLEKSRTELLCQILCRLVKGLQLADYKTIALHHWRFKMPIQHGRPLPRCNAINNFNFISLSHIRCMLSFIIITICLHANTPSDDLWT